jgi:hypothetical protein
MQPHNDIRLAAPPQHYVWAGLDFAVDAEGIPVLLEANKSSHMLGEYLHFLGDERPFALTAERMNAAPGPPCILWRRDDPFPDRDEDVCFITRHLSPYLDRPPVICDVEDNRSLREELVSRSGQSVLPGSLFRWWYDLPWTYERSGVLVINPNALWVAVRDKLVCTQTLQGAETFRVPRSFAVESPEEATMVLDQRRDLFEGGFVLKPRIGWGGYGVQIAEAGEAPRLFRGPHLLSERIRPALDQGRFWDVRVFVMNGVYLGGLKHTSPQPNTNYYQGGQPERLDDATAALLEPAAMEAVCRLDGAAAMIHASPIPETSLTRVDY